MLTNNRTARILPPADKANTQAWAPLVTAAGVLLNSAGDRGALPRVILALMDAFLAKHPGGTFAAVAHGVRAVVDGVSGAGAPFFLERTGAGHAQVYVFGGAGKIDAIRAACGPDGCASINAESGQKTGCKVTLNNGCDVDGLLAFLTTSCTMVGHPKGYRADMGAPSPIDSVAMVSPDASAPPVEAPKAPKGKRAKRDASVGGAA